MTEYWVSQGNHWCDFCKIYISNNPATIRNHELGTRHKDNVTKRIADMRKEKAAKEKKQQEAARSLEQIEAKAIRSYKKDLASQDDKEPHAAPADYQGIELGVASGVDMTRHWTQHLTHLEYCKVRHDSRHSALFRDRKVIDEMRAANGD
ncbi:hypothetical protein KSS87_018593 [Heliosperma pusillum]|nr:hypothetical protein KSS87_018593 [Heliosperma pusillum]